MVNVNTVCLPLTVPAEESFEYARTVLTGWGLVDNLGTLANILQKVNDTVTPVTECIAEHRAGNLQVQPKLNLCGGGIHGKHTSFM